MQLRRFQADSAPLALDAIRRAFGDDAVILSNRQVDDHVEMIATGHIDEDSLASAVLDDAVEALRKKPEANKPATVAVETSDAESVSTPVSGSEPTPTPAPTPSPSPAATVDTASEKTASPVVQSAVFPTVDPGDVPTDENTAVRDATDTSVAAVTPASQSERVSESVATSELKPVSAERPTDARVSVTVDDDLAPRLETLVAIDSESRDHGKQSVYCDEQHASIGRIEQRLQRLEANLWGELEPLKNAHIEQLLKIGIGAELAVRLVERLGPDDTTETAIRQSLALLGASLPIGVDNTTTEPGVTVVSGPAGSGKTTALLKLAHRHITLHGLDSVVLISADTRSDAAFELLQFHGTRLGVPVVQARDSRELNNLLGAFASKSLVLVDHMPLDHPGAFSLPVLAADDPRSVRHLLVLSAAMQACALEAQACLHARHGVTSLVLTQLDSAARLGSCFAPLIRQHLPIAYWSDAAEVDAPLQRADASILVATAMATARKFTASADELCQLNLMRPTRQAVSCNLLDASDTRVNATTAIELG